MPPNSKHAAVRHSKSQISIGAPLTPLSLRFRVQMFESHKIHDGARGSFRAAARHKVTRPTLGKTVGCFEKKIGLDWDVPTRPKPPIAIKSCGEVVTLSGKDRVGTSQSKAETPKPPKTPGAENETRNRPEKIGLGHPISGEIVVRDTLSQFLTSRFLGPTKPIHNRPIVYVPKKRPKKHDLSLHRASTHTVFQTLSPEFSGRFSHECKHLSLRMDFVRSKNLGPERDYSPD